MPDAVPSARPEPLARGIPPVRSRRGPRHRNPDENHDHDHPHRRLRGHGIRHRITHEDIESVQRPDRHRRAVERTVPRPTGRHRLHHRNGREAEHSPALTGTTTPPAGHRPRTPRSRPEPVLLRVEADQPMDSATAAAQADARFVRP
ncbi:hypothetical protein [Streptomyces cinereoruber]|uniref:hypothetical protein n=1 Tax=Streptomyces cinereoruber TaxID=67260 RepID=UPI0036450D31